MRIAVTATHGSGKTTLIEDFCAQHCGYDQVPEPYWLLAQTDTPSPMDRPRPTSKSSSGRAAG